MRAGKSPEGLFLPKLPKLFPGEIPLCTILRIRQNTVPNPMQEFLWAALYLSKTYPQQLSRRKNMGLNIWVCCLARH